MSDRSIATDPPSFSPAIKISPTAGRLFVAWFLASGIGLIGVTQAVAQQVCRPALAITDVQFSEWRLPTMERKWTAVVSVDASRCAVNSAGSFEIGFSRLIEYGDDIEFSEEFVWTPPSVKVELEFWANEAVGRYWINRISNCPCSSLALRD